MLELRPSCEHCDCPLPANSKEGMICTFECTFCRDCVNNLLLNVCPNCGGGFSPRPIRPKTNFKNDNYLGQYPAAMSETHKPVNIGQHQRFAESIKPIPPSQR